MQTYVRLQSLDNAEPFVLSSREVTVNQDHLIHLEVLLIGDVAVEPLTFAVKHLSLNVQEVILLIHDVFVNLRDLGNNEVK